MIQPRNNPELIKEFIRRYGLEPDQRLHITVDQDNAGQVSQSSIISFPSINDDGQSGGIRVQELFESWLNLLDPPSRYFVKTLSFFVEDSKKAEKLKEFASKTSVSKFQVVYSFSI